MRGGETFRDRLLDDHAGEVACITGRTRVRAGAERPGNADGSIPAWTGGITEPPAGYSPGDHHPSPWPEDKPLYRITGQNYQDYADKLSVGQIGLFEKYGDTYFMDVFQSRRSSSSFWKSARV